MRAISTVLLLLSAGALITFPFAYHFTSGGLWRYSQVGRSLMSFMGVLGLVMLLAVGSVVSRALGNGPLPPWVGVAVWSAIAFVSWRQVWVLFKVRRRKPHLEAPE